VNEVKLKYIGQTEREIPGQGVYAPGWEEKVTKEKAKILLSTELFEEVKSGKKGADK
jgi:hypothetical protein